MARDVEELLAQASAWQAEGLSVALATVLKTWGSSPRPPGSQLIVNANGAFLGSVSGGCIEGAVVTAALEVMQTRQPQLLEFGVTNDMAWEVGLACGGQVQVFVQPFADTGLSLNTVSALRDALKSRRPVALITTLPDGAQRLSAVDDAEEDPELKKAVADALLSDACIDLEPAGGPRRFVQPFSPPVRVVIIGAVHIAQPLSKMAALAGFDVILIDPRTAFATAERFPGVTLMTTWPGPALRELGVDARTAIVTLTHDPKLDDPALEAGLRSEAFYIGALGSGKTHFFRMGRLRARGFGDKAQSRVHGPVGMKIGARSPAEIAVSILAELVFELHQSQKKESESESA